MTQPLRVACVQLCAGPDTDRNLATLAAGIADAVREGAALVALPEYCATYGEGPAGLMVGAEPEAAHRGLAALRGIAREQGCWLAIGSLGVRAADGRTWNRSFLLDPEGAVRARYDKVHLFDVDLAGGESYRESATIAPGTRAVVAETPFGGVGLSICYDLRFPQLYRSLAKAGARILLVPAAFTRTTGRAHWHVLLRARAIETGCFVVAASQRGEAAGGRLARYGHSLVIDPWGEVLAEGGDGPGVVVASLDLGAVERARRAIPALRHDRAFALPQADGPPPAPGAPVALKTVRAWRPADRPAILALNAELQDHERQIRPSRRIGAEMTEPYLAEIERRLSAKGDDAALLVAEDQEGGVIGFVTCFVLESDLEQEPREALIEDVVVTARARGQGVGRALIEAACGFARVRGAVRMEIAVLTGNDVAAASYAAMGFVPARQTLELQLNDGPGVAAPVARA